MPQNKTTQVSNPFRSDFGILLFWVVNWSILVCFIFCFISNYIIGNSIYDRRVPTRRIYDRRFPSICNIQEKFEDTKWIIRSRKSKDKTIQWRPRKKEQKDNDQQNTI